VDNLKVSASSSLRKHQEIHMPNLGYPSEFKSQAIRLAMSGERPKAAVARSLGITVQSLNKWIRQAEIDSGRRQDGLTSKELEELRRLRRENKRLRENIEILGKFRAFSRKETGRPK
jgi:transposase